MAISCSRSLSSSTSRTFGFSPLIVFTLLSSKNRSILARASLRGVGQRTRRTARQRYAKVPAASAADDRDLAAVRLDELPCNGKPEPASLDAGFRLGPAAKKEIEDRFALFRRHAGARVHHLDDRLARERAGAHRDGPAGRRELHCVRNEVVDDRAQLLRIGLEGRLLRLDREPQALRLRGKLVRSRRV